MKKCRTPRPSARLGQLIEPKVIAQLHQRVVELAQERGVTQGRKLRVDTTVVENNIHYPTDSSLLGDGTLGADAHHEEDRVQVRRSETQGTGSHAQHTQARAGDCLIDPTPGAARRKAEKAAVSGASQLDVKSNKSGAESTGRSEAVAASSAHSSGRSDAIAGDHGGESWASSETDADTNFRRKHEVARERS